MPETGVPKLSCHTITLSIEVTLFVSVVYVSTRLKCRTWVILDAREPRLKIYWVVFASFPEPIAIMPREVYYATALVVMVTCFKLIANIFTGWHSSHVAFKPSIEVLVMIEIVCKDVCGTRFLLLHWMALHATFTVPVTIVPTRFNFYAHTVTLKITAPVFLPINSTTVGGQSHCIAVKPFFEIHVVLALSVALILVPEAVEPILVSDVCALCICVAIQVRTVNVATFQSCLVSLIVTLEPLFELNLHRSRFDIDSFTALTMPVAVEPARISKGITFTTLIASVKVPIAIMTVYLPTFYTVEPPLVLLPVKDEACLLKLVSCGIDGL